MDELVGSLSDLATGAGVAALASLSTAGDRAVWLALAGGAAGLLLCGAEALRAQPAAEVQMARNLLRLVLSATQFFRMWDGRDADVGAILVAIPLFLVACAPPASSLPDYVRAARALSAALNAVCLVGALIHSITTTEQDAPGQYPHSGHDVGLRSFLAVTDAAFAAAALGWPGGTAAPRHWWTAAGRSALLAALSASPSALRCLLRSPQPDWLLVVYGMALAQSTHVHACCVRLTFFSSFALSSPQRSLMLLVTPALAVGFVERRADPAHASFMVLAVVGAALLRHLLPCKRVHRTE